LYLKVSNYSPLVFTWGNIFKRPSKQILKVSFQMHLSRRIGSCRRIFHSACCNRQQETICIFRHLNAFLSSALHSLAAAPPIQVTGVQSVSTSECPDPTSYRLNGREAPKLIDFVGFFNYFKVSL